MLKVRNKVKFLDGEAIFRKYVEMGKAGSFNHLVRWTIAQGIINPVRGKPPSKMALWNAMWRWALHNPEVAKPLYSDYCLQFGDYLSDSEWKELMEWRAFQLLPYSGYRKYLKKHPELVEYANKRSS